jgi:hypothetical protein
MTRLGFGGNAGNAWETPYLKSTYQRGLDFADSLSRYWQ